MREHSGQCTCKETCQQRVISMKELQLWCQSRSSPLTLTTSELPLPLAF